MMINRRKSLTLHEKAKLALKEAIRNEIRDRKKTGRPLIVWKNGKVTRLSTKNL